MLITVCATTFVQSFIQISSFVKEEMGYIQTYTYIHKCYRCYNHDGKIIILPPISSL